MALVHARNDSSLSRVHGLEFDECTSFAANNLSLLDGTESLSKGGRQSALSDRFSNALSKGRSAKMTNNQETWNRTYLDEAVSSAQTLNAGK
jgi:hypothetical protein